MSWLLVVFIPGLLMLATFGLDRLEAGLDDDRESLKMAALLDRVQPVRPRTQELPGLPTRIYPPTGSNPEFQATRHANRV